MITPLNLQASVTGSQIIKSLVGYQSLNSLCAIWRLSQLYMGKKQITETQPRRTSTRPIKKKTKNEDQEEFFEGEDSDEVQSGGQDNSDEGYSESDGDDSNEEQQSSEQTPQIDPENLAVRNMKFRERRGTKMNYLINRKKQQEEDPFWAQQGQNYFGDLEDGDNDEEDYVQSSSGRDEFDSDFDQTESEHEEQEPQEEKEVDEEFEKSKKKRQELMRKIHAPAPVKKAAQKVAPSAKKTEKSDSQKKVPESTSRYIHEVFNQQQLLGEAATTEYFNWLSLKKLISLETEKKDFTRRSHHVEGPKITYRNRINGEGQRESTYELEGVEVQRIMDLTEFLNQN